MVTIHMFRRRAGGTTALLGLVASMALSLGVLAPAAPAAAVTSPPKISSFTPTSGSAGTNVSITGSNFTGVTAGKFAGVPAAFTVTATPTVISATVPAMTAATGPITVTTPGGTATSAAAFAVVPGLLVSPGTGPPGSAVKVSGTGFGGSEGVDIFADTTDLALAGTGPAGSFGPITIRVPASAVPGT